jgi:DNA polymerase-3 subunit alpha
MEIETWVNRDLVQLSRETGIPLVATNDTHYLRQSDARPQEVLMCIQTGKSMSDVNRMKFATDQFYFKTAEEMARVFRELPDAVARTVTIAERCRVKIQRVDHRSVSGEFQVPESHTATFIFRKSRRAKALRGRLSAVLEMMASRGIAARAARDSYERRLSSEIEMIQQMNFAGYFLIVWDFIHYARDAGSSGGAGARLGGGQPGQLRIATSPTSIRCSTICCFERFLNPERVSLPDIDIDFCYAAARRGDRVRSQKVRRAVRGANHHVWNDGGERRQSRTWAVRSTCPTATWTGWRSSFPISSISSWKTR